MAQQPKSYKKFVATAATASLVASALVPVASANVSTAAFTDVAPQYKNAVDFLVSNNISKGYTETQYGISMQIKRGDVAIMIANAAGLNDNDAAASGFTDVPTRGSLAVNSLKAAGVVNGKTATNFGFDDNITRGEAAIMLQKAFDLKSADAENNFTDVSDRYKDAVDALVANDVTKGINDTQFGTKNPIKRGDFAKFIYALKDQVVVEGVPVEGVTVTNPTTLTVTVKEADAELTAKDFNVKVDGEIVKVEKAEADTNGKNYTLTIPSLDGKKGVVSVNGKTADFNFVAAESGITDVKAINDTTVEVNFGQAIDKDFIREAEKNGEYFRLFVQGDSASSDNAVKSKSINFSSDGKTATFTLGNKVGTGTGDSIESGKQYSVALTDGDSKVASVKYEFGPTVLKAAATAPDFEVSATSDKIIVNYGEKMKTTALNVDNYEVYDNGGNQLGALADYVTLEAGEEGKWVDATKKTAVEFNLDSSAAKKLKAGQTYKLFVKEDVETDDNKKLTDKDRTITVKTPAVSEAQPKAKAARATDASTIIVSFDQNIDKDAVNANNNQVEVKTATGKTVTLAANAVSAGTGLAANEIQIKTSGTAEGELAADETYKVTLPANTVANAVFANASNDAISNLEAKAQDNVEIKSVKAALKADPKNDNQANLHLEFDQRPDISSIENNKTAVKIIDGTDEYVFDGTKADIKFTGEKSIVIEDVKLFKDGDEKFQPESGSSYTFEIGSGKLNTAAFGTGVTGVTNQSKLKATFGGVSVSAPRVDKVTLVSANEIKVDFKESISNVSSDDIQVAGYELRSNGGFGRTNITADNLTTSVSGNTLTLKTKGDYLFYTSTLDTNIEIKANSFNSQDSNNANDKIVLEENSGDFQNTAPDTAVDVKTQDNAAPAIVGANTKDSSSAGTAEEKAKRVQFTFTEAIVTQGTRDDVATLFSVTNAANNAVGSVAATDGDDKQFTVDFNKSVFNQDTVLSRVEVKYASGNTYYIKDAQGNKTKDTVIKGVSGKNPAATE